MLAAYCIRRWETVLERRNVGKLQQASREAGTLANDSSFFTLITQSRVSADGSTHKGVSVGFI